MSECLDNIDSEHCWHVSHTLTANPPITVRACCWCGGLRQDIKTIKPDKKHGVRAMVAYGFNGVPLDNGMTDQELDED